MKQTLLSRLILAGLAGLAVTAAQAGQIQASSVSIAREAVMSDTQSVIAPSIAYRFAGDVDARVQAQTFQVQFTLNQGTWGTLPAGIANAISVSDGVDGSIQDQSAVAPGANSCGVGVVCSASYTVVATGKSTDSKTLWATITVNQGATALIKQPLISLNVTANTIAGTAATAVAASRAPVTGMFTVVGSIVADYAATGICQAVKTLGVSFKHYVALTSPTAIATDGTATPDEHTRISGTNAATLIVFPTNLLVGVTPSTSGAFLTPGGNLNFSNNGSGGTSWINATVANLGSVKLTQNATGLDSNLVTTYALGTGGTGLTGSGLAAASMNAGQIEAKQVDVTVTASNGFVVGGVLQLSTNATCTGLLASSATTVTAATAAGPITVSASTVADVNAIFGAAGTTAATLCYTVPGTVTIPSSAFSAVATIVKAAAGAGFAEQNNTCNGSFYSLGGGLKIDVKNYASSAEKSGYMSVLRFINNSDAAVADVWAQIVHQNGKLGNWAKIADLPVRGVVNMTAAQIDAILAGSAGKAATAAVGVAAPVSQAAVTGVSTDTAPRLRITSTTGRSLRVQNYLFNAATGQILEGSGDQAVDFEGTATRAPASEGQYQSQDANSGLNLAP